MTSDVGSFGFSPVDDEIRTKWGWFVVLGIALLLLGLFAFANVRSRDRFTSAASHPS